MIVLRTGCWTSRPFCGCFLALFLGAALSQAAQDTNGKHLDSGTEEMLRSRDTAFAISASQGGIAKVQLGSLAASKAGDPAVKAFGRQMVDDHTKADDRLASLAQEQNMTLPANLTAKDQALYDKLSQLSGAAFDKAYVSGMLKDHKKDVKAFRKEAGSGKNPKIKNFAAETLPILQHHLDEVKSIQSRSSEK